jgi:flagellar biosynthesis protein FliQ
MMTGAEVLDVARDGIFTFLKVASPLMLIALAVGVVISLIQALTQIQEQTLIYVPKILLVGLGMILFLPFMGDALTTYMMRIAARIASGV